MAPVKKPQPSTRKGSKPSNTSSTSKFKSKSKDVKRPPPKQVKTKRTSTTVSKPSRPKKPQYTDAQLNLPAINSIVPANAATKSGRGAGKKRNKVYVDDTESMMTILAMVNAEKEGLIESKVLKARRLEEIREARAKEAEKKAEGRKGKLEEVKQGLKKRKGRSTGDIEEMMMTKGEKENVDAVKDEGKRKKRKSVSFV